MDYTSLCEPAPISVQAGGIGLTWQAVLSVMSKWHAQADNSVLDVLLEPDELRTLLTIKYNEHLVLCNDEPVSGRDNLCTKLLVGGTSSVAQEVKTAICP